MGWEEEGGLIYLQSNLYITALYIGVTCILRSPETPQNFQLPYIFCKIDLCIAFTLYITVTLPLPKGNRCTRVCLYLVTYLIVFLSAWADLPSDVSASLPTTPRAILYS